MYYLLRYGLIIILVSFGPYLLAQDQIITKNGEILNARVIEEGRKDVTYFLYDDNTRKPVTRSSKEIKKISYQKLSPKTNTVILQHDSLSGGELLSEMIGHLISWGYPVESFSREDLVAATKYLHNQRITLSVFGNEAKFQSYFSVKDPGSQVDEKGELMYGKKKEDIEKLAYARNDAFKDLDKICRSYLNNRNADISYKESVE